MKLTRDTYAQCGASRSVYKCIRKINAVKHGACLETSFQPSIYRSLPSPSIVSSPLHLRGSMRTRRDLVAGMYTFLSVTLEHVIVRLRARNNCILKRDPYIQTICEICLALRRSEINKYKHVSLLCRHTEQMSKI